MAENYTDEIYIRPSCRYSACRMYLGEHENTYPEFHLDDSEFDRITTEGLLILGDRMAPETQIYSQEIDEIKIKDVSYTSASMGVQIRALYTVVRS